MAQKSITRKTNPDVHIICGKCGCATMFKYSIKEDCDDNSNNNEKQLYVSLCCENCSTLTHLDEIIEEEMSKK